MREEPQPSGEGNARDGAVATYPLAGYVADGHICRDVMCSQCGYNLRTLACDARCPECDFSVAASLRSVDPHYADPRWLRRISRGLMLAACMPPTLAAMFVFSRAPSVNSIWLERMIVIGLPAIPFIGWLVGAWQFATPDPYRPIAGRTRRLIRPATLVFIAVVLCTVIYNHDPFTIGIAGCALAF